VIIDTPLFSLDVPAHGVIDGHVRLETRDAAPETLAVCGTAANVLSALLFDRLHAQGTNLIMSIKEDACRCDIVARSMDDGLGLSWQAITVEPERINEVQARLQDKTFYLMHGDAKEGHGKPEAKGASHDAGSGGGGHAKAHGGSVHKDAHGEERGHQLSEEEEEAFVKQITRIP
jgi:hypothetical protein